MKTTLLTTALMLLALVPFSAHSQEHVKLGAHIDQFKIECSGTLIVTGVSDVSLGSGLTDRAGNYHPPRGHADLKLAMKSASPGCDALKNIGVDLNSQSFEYYFSTPTTDVAKIKFEAEAHIGKTTPFEISQHFNYATADGMLPFFPLLHSEIVILKTTEAFYIQKNYEAKNPEATQHLYNTEKVQLTQAIFEFLKTITQESHLYSNLIVALLANAPDFQKDFRHYLEQILKIYADLENSQELPTESGFHFDWTLTHMAEGLAKLTHQFPEYYEFNIPQLLAHHPSMLLKNGETPNATSQDLENAIDLIEMNLDSGAYSSTVKFYLQEPLKHIAGADGTVSSKYISDLSSKYSKEKAKFLLKQHYAK